MILSVAAIIFTFGLVIFLHEAGHFIFCRILGVKVERFAFGFGPEVFGFTRGETRYSVCAFPLGGFVKPAGEDPGEATGRPDEYFGKPWHQRLLIVFAGPGMNYVLAWFLFTGLILWKGNAIPSTLPFIGDIAIDLPAAKGGLDIGDRIVSIDGKPVETWEEMARAIHANPERTVKIAFKRGQESREATVTPMKDPASGRGLIGIMPDVRYEPVGPLRAAKDGVGQCWYWTRYTVETLASKLYKMEKPDLAGPVGIMQMIGKAAHSGFEEFLSLIALISVAVGFFNLLPIPLLDGGHAVIYTIEGLSRRKLTPKVMSYANSFGLAFLLGVLLFATYQDIGRLRRPPWKQQKPPAEQQAPPGGSGSQKPAEPPAKSK